MLDKALFADQPIIQMLGKHLGGHVGADGWLANYLCDGMALKICIRTLRQKD